MNSMDRKTKFSDKVMLCPSPCNIFSQGTKRESRAKKILMGIVDLYLQRGFPIGSNALKEQLFPQMSSSAIRNYCADLESLGYLAQLHVSGGRFPTEQGISTYAHEILSKSKSTSFKDEYKEEEKDSILDFEKKLKSSWTPGNHQENLWGIIPWIEDSIQTFARISGCALAISLPRIEQDFITGIRLVRLDTRRISAILVTHFGFVHHEVILVEGPGLIPNNTECLEVYLHAKLHNLSSEESLPPEIELLGMTLYKEISVRFLLKTSHLSQGTILHAGLADLLSQADFCQTTALASAFSLFERQEDLRTILTIAQNKTCISLWIGKELDPWIRLSKGCAMAAIPYHLGHLQIGAVAILGPIRLQYRLVFGLLNIFQSAIEQALLRYVYRYKVDLKPYPLKNRLNHIQECSYSQRKE